MESIFSKIKSYTPTTKKDSKEDYLTELFAFILEKVESLPQRYCEFLVRNTNESTTSKSDFDINQEVDINTQFTIKDGRIDLLMDFAKHIFICEHKVFSSLSNNQINKYSTYFKKISNKRLYTVLITASKLQHTEKADIRLVWGEVCKFLEDFLINNELNPVDNFLVTQLISYLKEQGLGLYDAIEVNEIASNFIAQNFKNKLKEVFLNLQQYNWKENLEWFGAFSREDYLPQIQDKWGRLGISFFENWTPGVFAGVILDTTDHKIEPKDIKNGPDFVILIDIPKLKDRYKIIESKEFKELVTRLSHNSGQFEVLHGNFKNNYRILAIRRPLADIIEQKYTIDDQIEAIKNEIVKGLTLVLQDDLILKSFLQINA